MNLIKKFEQCINKKIDNLTEEDFLNILNSDILIENFKSISEIYNLFNDLSSENFSESILKLINTIKEQFSLINNEELLTNAFDEYLNNSLTREELIEKLKLFENSDDPIFSISAYICSMISLNEVDLKDEEEKIVKKISEIEKILSNLSPLEQSYSIQCEIIDLIYTLREKYFEIYDVDLLLENEWVDQTTLNLNIYGLKYVEKTIVPKNFKYKPSELGLLYTKEKGNENG